MVISVAIWPGIRPHPTVLPAATSSWPSVPAQGGAGAGAGQHRVQEPEEPRLQGVHPPGQGGGRALQGGRGQRLQEHPESCTEDEEEAM